MMLRTLWLGLGTLGLTAAPALAGGLFVPGSGAVSTSRAGASVAAVDDGEAIAINPAGMAKTHGTLVTLSTAFLNYDMTFTRAGTYDAVSEESVPYAGQPYAPVTNTGKPEVGFGKYQAVPVISVISDLGGRVPGLHVGFDIHAPNASPTRDMGASYAFPDGDPAKPPPATRYDIVEQTAAVILPTVAAAYRVVPQLDVGASFSSGIADLKSTVFLWGNPFNYEEWIKADARFTLHAKSAFVPTGSVGTTYRPTPDLEFAAAYTFPTDIHAKGDASSANGTEVKIQSGGTALPVKVLPVADAAARCAPGGTPEALKGCVDLSLPQRAVVGGRYKFRDGAGRVVGDVELDVAWENWGADSVSNYRVVVDGQAVIGDQVDNGLDLKNTTIRHGLQDTYGVRLGGSYALRLGADEVTLRGGVAHETAAAKPGWERVDLDGAARTMLTAGASYRMERYKFTIGAGYVYEGTRTSDRQCNPTAKDQGCAGTGVDAPLGTRQGPDPVNPLLTDNVQAESPVNQGTITSHYVLLMLGVATWF